MSVPYTYFLYHNPTGFKYYGVKFSKRANPELFWVPGGYYSSSVKVKELIEQYGADSFRAEVRKKFTCVEDAVQYTDFCEKLTLYPRMIGSINVL